MVNDVLFNSDEKGYGHFYVMDGDKQIAEMKISISENLITVYHTEVTSEAKGKGLAKKLFSTMVGYARSNKLKVIALCPFVHAQFKRHPDEYADIWKKTKN